MVEYGAAGQPQSELDLSDELGRSIIAARRAIRLGKILSAIKKTVRCTQAGRDYIVVDI